MTPGHLAVACFVLAAVLTPFIWVGRRPVREWRLRWIDGDDPDRRRQLPGAHTVTTPVVYRHLNWRRRCIYVGQTVDFAHRMYAEGKEIMSRKFHRTIAIACDREDLDRVERRLIARYRPHLNRTRGNR